VDEALARFQGYPRFHGTLAYQESGYDELVYEMWIDVPGTWVNIVGAPMWPWISDGETTNISEPHMHIGVMFLTDPTGLRCGEMRVIGHEEVVGRPSTVVGCRSLDGREEGKVWLDDATGLVLAGQDDGGRGGWTFTELEIDPVFPEGIFDLHPEPGELWFDVPSGPSLGPADEAIDGAVAAFERVPDLRGTFLSHTALEDHPSDRFDVYVRGPDLRVDVVIPGTTYPWVGTTAEQAPYPYSVAMGLDPGPALDQCRAPDVLAHEQVLGRSATAISCPDNGVTTLAGDPFYSVRVLWVDDGTGMILRGYYEESWGEHAGWFGFTELELDPEHAPMTFEVTPVLVPYANRPGPD
jgi:hypothetical protein